MKTLFGLFATLCLLIAVSASCTNLGPCGSGQQECGDGTCAPVGNTCCGGGTSCPPSAPICGVGDTCLSSNPVPRGCLSQGEETCFNNDGSEDCAPIGAACCGNHRWCPVGTVCINGGTGCGQ